MFTHILVPLDTSPFAEAALPYAQSMAESFGAKITLVSVVEMPTFLADEFNTSIQLQTDVFERTLEDSRLYLKGMVGVLSQQGYDVDMKLISGGRVAEQLIETADNIHADTIIMSTHGRSGVGRWLLGSVADRVLHLAHVPVILIRAEDIELPVSPLDDRAREPVV